MNIQVNDKVQFWLDETPMVGTILYAVGINGAAVALESGAEMFINLDTVTKIL